MREPLSILALPWQVEAFCNRFAKLRRSRRLRRTKPASAGGYDTGAMDAFKFIRTYTTRSMVFGGRIVFSFFPNGAPFTKADRTEMHEVVKFLNICAARRSSSLPTPPEEK